MVKLGWVDKVKFVEILGPVDELLIECIVDVNAVVLKDLAEPLDPVE